MVKDDRGIVLRQAFGRRLRAVRVLRGFKTGDELASAIGIRPEAYRRYERGEAARPAGFRGLAVLWGRGHQGRPEFTQGLSVP